MSGEKFCLKWNDFEKNISTSFRDLRSDRQLFDVTLACEDEHLQAHKVILSACSSFFRSILVRSSNHTNLLLYLKGISSKDMESVLNFMYHGEVSVAQDDLNGFLQVAEDLKVKGLTQGNNQEETVSKPQSSFQPKTTQRRAQQRPVSSHDADIQEVSPVVKTETGQGDSMVYDDGSGGVMAEYDDNYAEYGQYGDQEYDTSLMGQDPAMSGNIVSTVCHETVAMLQAASKTWFNVLIVHCQSLRKILAGTLDTNTRILRTWCVNIVIPNIRMKHHWATIWDLNMEFTNKHNLNSGLLCYRKVWPGRVSTLWNCFVQEKPASTHFSQTHHYWAICLQLVWKIF